MARVEMRFAVNEMVADGRTDVSRQTIAAWMANSDGLLYAADSETVSPRPSSVDGIGRALVGRFVDSTMRGVSDDGTSAWFLVVETALETAVGTAGGTGVADAPTMRQFRLSRSSVDRSRGASLVGAIVYLASRGCVSTQATGLRRRVGTIARAVESEGIWIVEVATSSEYEAWQREVAASTAVVRLTTPRIAAEPTTYMRIHGLDTPLREINYRDSVDIAEARGTSPSPIGYTTGTYSGNRGDFVYASPPTHRYSAVVSTSPTRSPPIGRLVSVANDDRSVRVDVGVGASAADVQTAIDSAAADVATATGRSGSDVRRAYDQIMATLRERPSEVSGYNMALVHSRMVDQSRRSFDDQIAQALRTYSQPPVGPTFDNVDITQPLPRHRQTFSNDVSASLTRENLDAVIRQIQQFRSSPDTIVGPPPLSVGNDLDAYVEQIYGFNRANSETDEQLRQRIRDRWQTLSPTSTVSLSQAITAPSSPPVTIHINEVAVDDAHAEAYQHLLGQMCNFLGQDVVVDDAELRGIAAGLDTARTNLLLVYWPEKRLLKVTTQREIVAAPRHTYDVLVVIRE